MGVADWLDLVGEPVGVGVGALVVVQPAREIATAMTGAMALPARNRFTMPTNVRLSRLRTGSHPRRSAVLGRLRVEDDQR